MEEKKTQNRTIVRTDTASRPLNEDASIVRTSFGNIRHRLVKPRCGTSSAAVHVYERLLLQNRRLFSFFFFALAAAALGLPSAGVATTVDDELEHRLKHFRIRVSVSDFHRFLRPPGVAVEVDSDTGGEDTDDVALLSVAVRPLSRARASLVIAVSNAASKVTTSLGVAFESPHPRTLHAVHGDVRAGRPSASHDTHLKGGRPSMPPSTRENGAFLLLVLVVSDSVP